MNTNQQTRLEIMKALEKDFPDRLLEDLIDVARYVETGGIEQDSAAKFTEEATDTPKWRRTWTNLEHIPDDARVVTDADGDVIRRVALGDRLVWKFEDECYKNVRINDQFGPFIEVLS